MRNERRSRRRRGSAGSILSIGSSGSILSIGSTGSILSIGSAGSILSVGSAGSLASVLSVASFASVGSALSGLSLWSVRAWRSRQPLALIDVKRGRVSVGGQAAAAPVRPDLPETRNRSAARFLTLT
jgi:hypothetical protein